MRQKNWKERKWQTVSTHEVLEGNDTIVVTATGTGKTLCFQALSIVKPRGVVCVVSPLLSLMKDHDESNAMLGISSCRLTRKTLREDPDMINRAAAGEYSMVFISPEMINLRDANFEKLLGMGRKGGRRGGKKSGFSDKLFAIIVDEAHLCYTW